MVADTGNTMLDATVRIRITDTLGRTIHTYPKVELSALLPSATATIQEKWDHLPHLGRYRVKVSVAANGAAATGGAIVWILPPLLLLIVFLVLCAIAFLLWRNRRRRRKSLGAPEPLGSAPEPASSVSSAT